MNRPPHAAPAPPRAGVFDAIPLPIRMVVYGVSFLAAILVLLPWCASRLDDVLPPGYRIALPTVVRVFGGGAFVAFLAIYVSSSYVLTSRGRGAYVEFDPPKEFVVVGPFRWCRNPIAACVVGMLAAEGLALSSMSVIALAAISVPIAHAQVVLLEEPLLRKRFGGAYEEYLRRVPRWIPRMPR